jgi:Glycosyltransferase
MNVLIVSEPGVDGVFRYVERLVDHLLGRDVRVHLAYSDSRAGEALARFVDRVEDAGGRTLNLRVGNRPCLDDLRALLALRTFVRDLRPDLIHCHSAKAGALARLLPVLGILDVPLLYQPHAYIGMRPARGRLDFAYDAVERVLGRWSTTLTCSYDEQNYALHRLRIPPARARIVLNGVDTLRFFPAAAGRRRELRAAFGIPDDAVVLGSICRSSAQKDPITLYHAFARVAARDPRLVLFHVGRGEFDPELERIVRENGLGNRVLRRPYLSDPVEFYQAVDGFALASRYEGFSLALLEALAADLPLIVSEAPGNGDILGRPLSHLWHAPVGDVAAFSSAIGEWAAECASAVPTRRNHREIARTYYDQRRSLARVVSLYGKLRPSPAPSPGDTPAYARA